jgi:hypothetical protein
MGFESILAVTTDLVDQGGIGARLPVARRSSDVENIADRGCDTSQQALPAVMDQGMTLPGQTQSLELGAIEQEPLPVDDVEAAIAETHALFP